MDSALGTGTVRAVIIVPRPATAILTEAASWPVHTQIKLGVAIGAIGAGAMWSIANGRWVVVAVAAILILGFPRQRRRP